MPSVASTDPMMEVNLSPILSLRMPTRKERKNVVPIVRLPIKAAVISYQIDEQINRLFKVQIKMISHHI